MARAGYHLSSGTVLRQGKYRIETVLGEGGFGITYRGIDVENGRKVAIKENWPEKALRDGNTVVWPQLLTVQERQWQLQKFEAEANSISKCYHPCIVKVYDWFEENDTAYVVMAFIEGKPLSKIIAQGGPLPQKKVKHYFLQLTEALSKIHAAHFLHRDIKPDNIMINRQDRAVLIDFGAAKEIIAGRTHKMSITLTPGYAPIEQYYYRSKRWPATDIYALCASMYEAITGQFPVPATERYSSPLIAPSQWISDIDPHLEEVILKGMEMQVKDRLQTAEALIHILSRGGKIAKLVSVSTSAKILEFLLDSQKVIVGCSGIELGPADINLAEFSGANTVSRQHAVIYLEAGAWKLQDLRSSNGTFIKRVGQSRFSPKITSPQRLNSGDEIAFGKSCFIFQHFGA